jgi:hypothetical protein
MGSVTCTSSPERFRDRDRAHALDHLGEHVELDLDGIGVVDVQVPGRDEVAGDDRDDPDHEVELGRDLRDRLGLSAQEEELLLLRRQVRRGILGRRVQHRLHPEGAALGARASPRHDEGPNEVVAAAGVIALGHDTNISCLSSATSAGVSTLPARSTRRVVW